MDAWKLLQIADSALPTGGFAHSGGLEAAIQLELCRGAAGLELFLEESLWQCGMVGLPWVTAAHAQPERLAALDVDCDASTPHHVANRASRIQGQALLRALAAVCPAELGAWADAVTTAREPCHLAPVFGVALGRLGAARDETRRLFLFQAARGIVFAAIRLGVVGPLDAQRLLGGIGSRSEQVLRATDECGIEDVAATSPLIDLAQAHQDRLYSRLFQS